MTADRRVWWINHPPKEAVMAAKKPATAGTKRDAPKAEANGERAEAAKPQAKPVKPPAPTGRPLFRDQAGRARQVGLAVFGIEDRYADGDLAGLPRTLTLVGAYSVGSAVEAAALARKVGVLADGADAAVVNGRFATEVAVPREQPESESESPAA